MALFVQGEGVPRKLLIRNEFFPYHVTNRTREKTFYDLPLRKVWSIYADYLRVVTWAFGAQIHAFVLMNNHYHLLISTPYGNIDQIMQFFQAEVSKALLGLTASPKCKFDTRYKWTLIRDKNYFLNAYRYVYQNPLRAGIVKTVADYSFSTFHGRAGYSKLEIPVTHHAFFEENPFASYVDEEKWLNERLPQDQIDLIRKGIRRFEFILPDRDRQKLQRPM
jgi:putative transposase